MDTTHVMIITGLGLQEGGAKSTRRQVGTTTDEA